MSNLGFRDTLKTELAERKQRNPHYSLRSFARDMGLSASLLSEVLRGRHGLSKETAEVIATKLGLSSNEKSLFIAQVQSVHARSSVARAAAQASVYEAGASYKTLTADAYRFVADWYHYAMLELFKTKGAKPHTEWIARRLGIIPDLIEPALDRLKRMGLIAQQRDGKFRTVSEFVASPDGVPSKAVRRTHEQILEKAKQALHFQQMEERDFSNVVLAFDPEEIQEARKMIRDFRRAFDRKFAKSKNRTSVYTLSINFFRLSNDQTGDQI